MATIGASLSAPEAGWRRYPYNDSRFLYKGTWAAAGSGVYNSSASSSDRITFKFYGSKLRIMTYASNNVSTRGIDQLTIDGTGYTYNEYTASTIDKCLSFEKTDLSLGVHTCVIAPPSNENSFTFTAIDIESTGHLLHPILNEVPSISMAQIGDVIPCRFTVTSAGTPGTTTEFGTCTAAEIPVAGTATPDGLFYFVKVDKGLFIGDRVVQQTVPWDALNTVGYIQGKYANVVPTTVSAYSTGLRTSLNNQANLIKLFQEAYNSTTNYYNDTPTSVRDYLQFSYAGPVSIKSLGIRATTVISGYEPLKNFTLTASASGTFNDEVTIFSGAYGASDTNEYFYFPNKNSYTSYRFYIDSWYPDNGADGQNIRSIFTREGAIIRSISGGNAFLGTDGKPATTSKSLGCWPPNNEYDTYIAKSTLNGKIAAGDVNIWHNNAYPYTYTQDTPILAIITQDYRLGRLGNSTMDYISALTSTSTYGFRPVLEYPEDSKCTNIWY